MLNVLRVWLPFQITAICCLPYVSILSNFNQKQKTNPFIILYSVNIDCRSHSQSLNRFSCGSWSIKVISQTINLNQIIEYNKKKMCHLLRDENILRKQKIEIGPNMEHGIRKQLETANFLTYYRKIVRSFSRKFDGFRLQNCALFEKPKCGSQ